MIGIISYLPDDKNKRANRRRSLRNLIEKCEEIFNLPVFIIAQNYAPWEADIMRSYGCTLVEFNKLGILRARYELQQLFLSTTYDNLIMLDDDCILEGSRADGDKYMRQLNSHPGSYGIYSGNLLKLFSISKTLYSQFKWPLDLSVEEGDLFEDIYLTAWLRSHCSSKGFRYSLSLRELSNSQNDPNSTWSYADDGIRSKMLANTLKLVYNRELR